LGALRPGVVEVERQRNHLALLHQARRGDDIFGRRVVERADLVMGAPFAPVLVLLGGGAHVLARDLSGSHLFPLVLGGELSLSGRAKASPLASRRRGATISKNQGGKNAFLETGPGRSRRALRRAAAAAGVGRRLSGTAGQDRRAVRRR